MVTCTRIFTLATLSVAAFAQAGLSPEQLVTLKSVTSLKIAPDGGRVAYVLRVPRPLWSDDPGPAYAELHIVDREGKTRRFATGRIEISQIEWSSDGGGITFLQKGDGDDHKSLYYIPVDGGQARRVLDHSTDIEAYSFSPDNRRVAFTAKSNTEDQEKSKKHGYDAVVFEEDWQFSRLWIAPEVLTTGLDSKEGEAKEFIGIEGSISAPLWSPNGKYIAVKSAPTPSVDDSYMRTRISIVDGTTGKLVREIATPGKIGDAAWSPDSGQIALIAGIDVHDPSPGRIVVASPSNDGMRTLLADFPGQVNAIDWLDNGIIAFLADQGVWSTYNTVADFGSEVSALLDTGDYSLSAMSVAPRARAAAFIGDSPAHPGEVFLLDRGGKPKRLTHSNLWLDNHPLAEQEIIRFRARDGMELEGILITPSMPKPSAGYPLIMMVHGGPESHHRNGWLSNYGMPGQVAAARGFAAFYTNYRGSTGRGVAFSKVSQNDPAGAEFNDLIDAIDHLSKRGTIDNTKVGITGASYGGYASAWGATKLTEHFAAAVMGVGVSDMLLNFALGDIPEEHAAVHFLQYPWENPELFRERSPITYFEQARTPLLILHGDADPRVHPSNSKLLYRMLKTYGKVPVRLVLYPGEGHGNRKSSSQLDWCLRLMQWMEHYVTGPGGEPPAYELDLSTIKKDDEE